jgi:hypothetical protein
MVLAMVELLPELPVAEPDRLTEPEPLLTLFRWSFPNVSR